MPSPCNYHISNYFFISLNSLRPGDAYMRLKTIQHCFRQWLFAWPAPSHYLNQCWDIVNWTLRNKFEWNFNRNSYLFIRENEFQNVVRKMTDTFSRSQYVKWSSWADLHGNTGGDRATINWFIPGNKAELHNTIVSIWYYTWNSRRLHV